MEITSQVIDVKLKNYRQTEVHEMKQEVIDNNCHTHSFYHALHESHAIYNVVRVEDNGQMYFGPRIFVAKCVDYTIISISCND